MTRQCQVDPNKPQRGCAYLDRLDAMLLLATLPKDSIHSSHQKPGKWWCRVPDLARGRQVPARRLYWKVERMVTVLGHEPHTDALVENHTARFVRRGGVSFKRWTHVPPMSDCRLGILPWSGQGRLGHTFAGTAPPAEQY